MKKVELIVVMVLLGVATSLVVRDSNHDVKLASTNEAPIMQPNNESPTTPLTQAPAETIPTPTTEPVTNTPTEPQTDAVTEGMDAAEDVPPAPSPTPNIHNGGSGQTVRFQNIQ